MDKKLLWWIFGVTKGGAVRAEIVRSIKERPVNANYLAQELSLDYTTVRYHLDVLLKHKVLTALQEGRMTVYFLSDDMEKDYHAFLEIYKVVKGKEE